MKSQWTIKYYDGETATAHPCTVQIQEGRLFILDSAGVKLDIWDVKSIQYDPNHLDHKFLMLAHEKNARIEMLDTDLELALPHLKKSFFNKDRSDTMKIVVTTIALSAAIIFGIYKSLKPISHFIAQNVPPEYETKMAGRMNYEELFSSCKNKAIFDFIRKTYPDLEQHLGSLSQIDIVKMDQPNAFAFLGGKIVLTNELITEATSLEEIIAVIAHEKGHIYHRHLMQSLIRSGLISIGMFAFSGTSDIVQNTAMISGLVNLKFDRELEQEADLHALKILKESSISSQGLINFFERSKPLPTSKIPEFLSNHPQDEARINDLKAQVIETQKLTEIPKEYKLLACED